MEAKLEISPLCIMCDSCKLICPENAVITDGKTYFVDQWSCTMCHLCIEICPVDCIKIVTQKS